MTSKPSELGRGPEVELHDDWNGHYCDCSKPSRHAVPPPSGGVERRIGSVEWRLEEAEEALREIQRVARPGVLSNDPADSANGCGALAAGYFRRVAAFASDESGEQGGGK